MKTSPFSYRNYLSQQRRLGRSYVLIHFYDESGRKVAEKETILFIPKDILNYEKRQYDFTNMNVKLAFIRNACSKFFYRFIISGGSIRIVGFNKNIDRSNILAEIVVNKNTIEKHPKLFDSRHQNTEKLYREVEKLFVMFQEKDSRLFLKTFNSLATAGGS